MTVTHLPKKKTRTARFDKLNNKMKYLLKIEYFCGPGKNLTISSEDLEQVTCKKCLEKLNEQR